MKNIVLALMVGMLLVGAAVADDGISFGNTDP
jgi:hypothetical protein